MGDEQKHKEAYLLSNEDMDRLFLTKYKNKKMVRYAGCFLQDELKDMVPQHGLFYIVNIDREPNKNGGTHWVLIFNVHDTIIYVDPFGLPPSEIITSFLKRAKHKDGKKKTIFYTTA